MQNQGEDSREGHVTDDDVADMDASGTFEAWADAFLDRVGADSYKDLPPIDADHYLSDEATPCANCNGYGKQRGGLFCDCAYGRRKQKAQTQRMRDVFGRAGLPDRLRSFTLDTWDDRCGGEGGKTQARSLVRELVEDGHATGPEGVSRPGLLLLGENGIGKTGLLVGLLKRMYAQGWSVLWIKWADMIDDIQATYGDGASGVSTEGRLATVQNAPALFLDDFGEPFRPKRNFRVSQDRRSLTWRVLSARHEKDWPTFMTTNHDSLQAISDQFSPRIADRIMETCTIAHMSGDNLRHPSNQ